MLMYVMAQLGRLRGREDGQAMVEYALILGLISVVAIAVLTSIGKDIVAVLTQVETALAGA